MHAKQFNLLEDWLVIFPTTPVCMVERIVELVLLPPPWMREQHRYSLALLTLTNRMSQLGCIFMVHPIRVDEAALLTDLLCVIKVLLCNCHHPYLSFFGQWKCLSSTPKFAPLFQG